MGQGSRPDRVADQIRGELLPTVQLEANYTKRFDPTALIDWTETSLVTGRVTVPFYTGGEVQARVPLAAAAYVVVYEGKIGSLRRFKDDVSEVKAGSECGIGFEKFNDIKVGDVIEVFAMERVAITA